MKLVDECLVQLKTLDIPLISPGIMLFAEAVSETGFLPKINTKIFKNTSF